MSYKQLIPCIFIRNQKAVTWFDDMKVVNDDPITLAKFYSDCGADELLLFDLNDEDQEHDQVIEMVRKMHRLVRIPIVAGGNVKRLEDVKKYLYAGAKRAILNFSKNGAELIESAEKRFGKDKIAVSLNDFDTLFKHQHTIADRSSQLIFMHRLDLNSVVNVTNIPFIVLTDTMDEKELLDILQFEKAEGLSGLYISQTSINLSDFKVRCTELDIKMTSFESVIPFSEFKLNAEGLLPVITQDYKTGEVLMMAYMNEQAFNDTIKTGTMTYYSRSRQSLWVKGETSGHYQYVKSLTIDCDKDTMLAQVDQIGAACHTGNPSCFFTSLAGENDEKKPLKVFESVYATILDRKENPREGSYTNYLFDKGIDKILKKVGEEASELIIAAKNPNPEEIKYELSDFLYHAMVLMVEKGITWDDIIQELAER
ncbi:MAG: bifunctional phosphoribosyl-AMP cyclohydrolase/phosphoribosyl-ATP diphosphatase HisIE [Lachnospiraceae bacterium]